MIGRISNIAGTCLIAAIILISVPFFIPRLAGYEIFTVLSDSMEPTYPKGSIVYVKPLEPIQVQVGDAITFRMGADSDILTTHRVESIDLDKQVFQTKGDANESTDAIPVSFDRLLGKSVFSLPLLGNYAEFVQSLPGMVIGVSLFIIAIMLWYIGSTQLPDRRSGPHDT